MAELLREADELEKKFIRYLKDRLPDIRKDVHIGRDPSDGNTRFYLSKDGNVKRVLEISNKTHTQVMSIEVFGRRYGIEVLRKAVYKFNKPVARWQVEDEEVI